MNKFEFIQNRIQTIIQMNEQQNQRNPIAANFIIIIISRMFDGMFR